MTIQGCARSGELGLGMDANTKASVEGNYFDRLMMVVCRGGFAGIMYLLLIEVTFRADTIKVALRSVILKGYLRLIVVLLAIGNSIMAD